MLLPIMLSALGQQSTIPNFPVKTLLLSLSLAPFPEEGQLPLPMCFREGTEPLPIPAGPCSSVPATFYLRDELAGPCG